MRGLKAAAISAQTTPDVIKDLCSGNYELFFTPEMILTEKWKNLLSSSDFIQQNLLALVFPLRFKVVSVPIKCWLSVG